MAIVKCKECGGKVSTKAKSCPNCGAKPPKKTSLFTWLVLFVFVFFIYISGNSDKTNGNSLPISNSLPSENNTSDKELNTKVKTVKNISTKPAFDLVLKPKSKYKSDAKILCTKDWTKRGQLDQRMFDHCMEGQMEGYEKVKELHGYIDQKFYSDTAYPYCTKRWTKRDIVNSRMLAHCLEQEVEGIQDVMFYRKQYGEDKVNQIVGRALGRYGSWNMAAYTVERAFE